VTDAFRVQHLDHVSLNVRDRATSIAWYRDVLGLRQKNEPRADDWPVFMGDFGACVALFQAARESPEREEESTGLRHLAFALSSEDLERARAHL
jgi:catechol 2,3-dioxygenase-like lactoylglutathione lyase family enzyme